MKQAVDLMLQSSDLAMVSPGLATKVLLPEGIHRQHALGEYRRHASSTARWLRHRERWRIDIAMPALPFLSLLSEKPLSQSVTCPNCWHTFPPESVLWIAVGLTRSHHSSAAIVRLLLTGWRPHVCVHSVFRLLLLLGCCAGGPSYPAALMQ